MDRSPEPWAIVLFVLAILGALALALDAASAQNTDDRSSRGTDGAFWNRLEPGESGHLDMRGKGPRSSRADIHLALQLSRMAELECTSAVPRCFNDQAAIYGVGVERFGTKWVNGLQRYTKLYARGNARARHIARLPWGDVPGWSKRRNRQWHKFRLHALAVIAGLVDNPCPGAVHWGSPRWDVIPPSLKPVRCKRRTGNLFLRRR